MDERALHSAYHDLLARAASSGWIEPGGLTPREQCATLSAHPGIPEAHRPGWERLERLLDRCVYAGRGTDEEEREALALVAERHAFLEGPPPRPTAAGPKQKQNTGRRFDVPWGLLAVAAAAVAAVAFAPALLRGLPGSLGGFSVASSSPASTGGSWSDSLRGERAAVEEIDPAPWSSPAEAATWHDMHVDPVARADVRGNGSRLDLATGMDGILRGVPDPFQPPMSWAHRLRVSTGIDSKYQFVTAAPAATPAFDPGAQGAYRSSAKVRVALEAGKAVPIPSPSPDAVVTSWRSSGGGTLMFTKDAGDALRVTGDRTEDVDLAYETVSKVDYEHGALPDTPFSPAKVSLPTNVRKDAKRVLDRVGGMPCGTFRATVRRLQAYCSGFVVAPMRPKDRQANDFLTLAMARKGVCRHRALVFFVIANAAGVRTRYVENQAHAYCEVQLPDATWRRIEFRLEAGSGPPGAAAADVPYDFGLLRTLARGSAFGIVLAALGVIVLLGLLADANRHRLPRTAIRSSHAVRAHRDAPLLRAKSLQESARMLSEEVGAGQEALPPGVAMRGKSLSEFAATPAPEVDAATLQHLKWDFMAVLRWLRAKRGDERK